MVDALQFFRDWIAPVVAVFGFGIAVWGRIETWRENRRKAEDTLPWATLSFSGMEQVESATHSVRTLCVEFKNPSRPRWVVDQVEVLAPSGALLRKRGSDGLPWTRKLTLDWIVPSVDHGEGRSGGYLDMRFQKAPVTNVPGPPREVAVRLRTREVSSKGRRRTIEARTIRRF